MTSLLDAALRYAAHGWHVFPCGGRGKTPATPHGFKDATVDPGQIRRWWSWDPGYNIGLATGSVSGVFVVDLDGPDGVASWDSAAETRGVTTLRQATGRDGGGEHLFFRTYGEPVKNRAALLFGVDIRGDGGYVVLPPSIHPTGRPYRWVGTAPIAEAPEWLRELVAKKKAPTKKTKLRSVPGMETSKYGQTALEQECAAIIDAPDGQQNDTINRAAFAVGQLVAGGEITAADAGRALHDAARQGGHPDNRAAATIASGLDKGQKDPRSAPDSTKNRRGPAPSDSAPPPTDGDRPEEEDGDDWRDKLVTTTKGEVKVGLANALVYVRHHDGITGRLQWDERSQVALWKDAPPWGGAEAPRSVIDADSVELALYLAEEERVQIGDDALYKAILAESRRNTKDDVLEWLSLIDWDGQDRVNFWLSTYLGVQATPYAELVGAAWMISAVARAFQPGCQADHLLVLEGEQGTRKSSAIEALAPEWYADISVDPTAKDTIMALHGPWIVEWSELAGLNKREAEQVKSFLTRRSDRVRPPYGRTTVDLPRRCVLAGSTNEGSYLTDPTGSRRYWPVRCGRIDLDGIKRDRVQLWAEAAVRYHSGEQWWLDSQGEAEAAAEQADRTVADPWADTLTQALDGGKLSGRDWVSSDDLLEQVGVPSGQRNTGHSRRVASVMASLKWSRCRKRDRTNGAYQRGYQRPGVLSDVSEGLW